MPASPFDLFPSPPLFCPACNEEICICNGTSDGPGQPDAAPDPT